MSLGQVAVRGARTTLIGQALRFAIQVAAIVSLARILDPSDFGIVAMVTAVTSIAALITDAGLSTASMQAEHISAGQRSNLFWINVGLGVIAAAAVAALSVPLSNFYGEDRLVAVVWVLSPLFLLSALSAQFLANAARDLRFSHLAILDVAAAFGALVVAISMALLGFGYWALVSQQVAFVVLRLVAVVHFSKWRPGPPCKEPTRGLVTFGAHTFGVQFITHVTANIDSIIIGRYLGPTVLGVYDRSYQLFRLPMQQALAPMTRVAVPILAKIQDDLVRLNSYLIQIHRAIVYTVGAGLVFLATVGGPLIAIVLGPGWEGIPRLLAILAVGGIFQMSGYVYFWAFLARGATGLQLRFTVVTRLLLVGLIIGGVQFGLSGVAIAVSSGLFVNWLVISLWPARWIGVDVRALLAGSARPAGLHVGCVLLICGMNIATGDRLAVGLELAAGSGLFLCWYGLFFLLVAPVRRDILALAFVVKAR